MKMKNILLKMLSVKYTQGQNYDNKMQFDLTLLKKWLFPLVY